MTSVESHWLSLGLPASLGADLLQRWNEPHRHYHGQQHLSHGLEVLQSAPRSVGIAWWFHDAVHSCRTPQDEQRSAQLARHLLTGLLPVAEVDEICRLVLLTIDHRPTSDDPAGAVLCDADLHSLTLPNAEYRAQVAGLRAERPDLDDQAWQAGRIARVQALLARPQLFHTEIGHTEWEPLARRTLVAELADLLGTGVDGMERHE